MVNSLTKEQRKSLLMLADAEWDLLRSSIKNHYKLGSCMPEAFNFLVALTSKQWQTVEQELTEVREKQGVILQALRKQVRYKVFKKNKAEYMRKYMQEHRRKDRTDHGQGSNQDSG